jgi:hypothetical protein
MTRSKATATICASPEGSGNELGARVSSCPRFETAADQVSTLMGTLALRASEWGWRSVYERWRRGEPVSVFHRKFMAVSAHYRARGRDGDFDHRAITAIRPLPVRPR